MKQINLTDVEVRAINELLDSSISACDSYCVFSEMTNKPIDCPECPFTKAVSSIREKIGENND